MTIQSDLNDEDQVQDLDPFADVRQELFRSVYDCLHGLPLHLVQTVHPLDLRVASGEFGIKVTARLWGENSLMLQLRLKGKTKEDDKSFGPSGLSWSVGLEAIPKPIHNKPLNGLGYAQWELRRARWHELTRLVLIDELAYKL